MGEPENQLEESVVALLRKLAWEGTLKLPEDVLHRLGLDVYVLDGFYQCNVQPQLDYMAGYQHFTKLYPTSKHFLPDSSWEETIRDASFPARRLRQVLTVFNERLDGPAPVLYLAVFLTREDQWVVWIKRSSVGAEEMRIFETVHELFGYIQETVSERYHMESTPHGRCAKYIPLRIAQNIVRDVLGKTEADKEKRWLTFKAAREDGSNRLGLISF